MPHGRCRCVTSSGTLFQRTVCRSDVHVRVVQRSCDDATHRQRPCGITLRLHERSLRATTFYSCSLLRNLGNNRLVVNPLVNPLTTMANVQLPLKQWPTSHPLCANTCSYESLMATTTDGGSVSKFWVAIIK